MDVIGAINQTFTSFDSQGNQVNDPYPTNFASGGFDLDAVALLFPQTVSLPEISHSNLFYPNPSKGQISFSPDIHSCKVYSLNGSLLYEYQEDLQTISLSSGTYILEMISAEEHIFEKLVVL